MPATPLPVATSKSRTWWWRRSTRLAAPGFWCSAVILSAWLLWISWQKWIDPLIDFGVQLYLPWRITLGEHLGRDFVHPYGPLSSYFNAALFQIFGVSLQTLVAANLVIFAAIFICLHFLLRRAFGFAPAAVATLAGIAVFGFSNFTGINNYTYAAPYSHEVTHGLLLLLLLLLWLSRRWSRPEPSALVPGLLLGLIALTKIEIVFAAFVALACFALGRRLFQRPCSPLLPWGLKTLATAAGVLFATWTVLALTTDARSAAIAVGSGTLSPLLYRSYVTSDQARLFLGTDQPVQHAANLLLRGGWVIAVIWGISSALAAMLRVQRRWARLLGGALVGVWLVAAWWTLPAEMFTAAADAFPALLAVGGAVLFFRHLPRREALTSRAFTQIILLAVAFALMSRMALAPRLFHYGFVQALLAATWIFAFYVGEWPRFLSASQVERRAIGVGLAVLLAGVTLSLMRVSRARHEMKSEPIGLGGDRFLGYAPVHTPAHRYVEMARDYLATHTSPSSTLLVVPEGIMLNYLAKRKTPLRITNLLPATLRLNPRDVLAELTEHPPDYVLFISRMVGDDPILPFGSDEPHGRPILLWVAANYLVEAKVGGDPLVRFEPENAGWILMKRKAPAR